MVKSVYYWLGRKKNFSNHRAQETLLLGFLLLGERVRITVACKQNGSGSVTIKRLWPARLNPSLSFARESVKLRSKVEFNTMRVRRVHEANEAVTSKKKKSGDSQLMIELWNYSAPFLLHRGVQPFFSFFLSFFFSKLDRGVQPLGARWTRKGLRTVCDTRTGVQQLNGGGLTGWKNVDKNGRFTWHDN